MSGKPLKIMFYESTAWCPAKARASRDSTITQNHREIIFSFRVSTHFSSLCQYTRHLPPCYIRLCPHLWAILKEAGVWGGSKSNTHSETRCAISPCGRVFTLNATCGQNIQSISFLLSSLLQSLQTYDSVNSAASFTSHTINFFTRLRV